MCKVLYLKEKNVRFHNLNQTIALLVEPEGSLTSKVLHQRSKPKEIWCPKSLNCATFY